METGFYMAMAFIVFGVAQMVYIFYRGWKQDLVKREKLVNDAFHAGIFENNRHSWNDGSIFCSVWRLSHIRNEAEKLGYVLMITDYYSVVNRIKREFDPEVGINLSVIRQAIKEHVMSKIQVDEIIDTSLIGDRLQEMRLTDEV